MLRAMLNAYDIPHGVTAGFGAIYPGLQIDNYTTRTILVSPGAYDEASELIQQYLSSPGPAYEPTSLWDRVRIVVEAVIFGWFVPKGPLPITDPRDAIQAAGKDSSAD